jgi:hypothetical protein
MVHGSWISNFGCEISDLKDFGFDFVELASSLECKF